MAIAAFSAKYNPNTVILSGNTGITLVSLGGKVPHQAIVIEEVDKNGISKKNYIAELTTYKKEPNNDDKTGKYGYTRYRELDNGDHNRIVHKTNTIVDTTEKMKTLVDRLKSQDRLEYPYVFTGTKTALSENTHVVNLYDPDGVLNAFYRADRELFWALYDSYKNEGLCTRLTQQEFDDRIRIAAKKIDEKGRDKDLHINHGFTASDWEYLSNEQHEKFNTNISYDSLITLMKNYAGPIEEVKSGNCISWSKDQLKKSGFDFKYTNNVVDKIIRTPLSPLARIPSLEVQRRKDSDIEEDEVHQIKYTGNNVVPVDYGLTGRAVSFDTNRPGTPTEIKKLKDEAGNANEASVIRDTGLGIGIVSSIAATVAFPPLAIVLAPALVATHVSNTKKTKAMHARSQKKIKDTLKSDPRLETWAKNNPKRMVAFTMFNEDFKKELAKK